MTASFKKRFYNIAHTMLLASGLIISASMQSAWAQNQQALQPYHIEVVIFERTNAAYNAPEHWPENVVLTYPPNYRVIHTPAESTELTTQPSQQLAGNAHREHSRPNTQNPETIAERIVLERPKSTYLLTNAARAINRKSSMRVLFHKAWQQTLVAPKQSPAIIINGGDSFDGRTELGGSIRFSLNKFIHVDSQLWLARFTPNYGQELNWPIPPIAPTALNTQARANYNMTVKQDTQDYGINTQAVTSTFNNTEAINNSDTFKNTDALNRYGSKSYTGTIGLQQPLSFSQDTPQLNNLTDEVVTLIQSRRMRSQEMHYIDHPRLGILIKVVAIPFSEAQ
ncbi:CsiV family protein [Marinagarivorans algicola]|uniref:CsiV family protein n=1 Tax=Marinagarivorans algicola TaxID=1513270 RepID=UPI0006B8FEE6|nr:CsiV family protein [Marinagarivorans algicola]